MKKVKLTVGKGFALEADLGPLNGNFKERSLLAQLVQHLETFPCTAPHGSDQTYLVFDPDEEALAMDLLGQLSGGVTRDRGMGNEDMAEIIAFDGMLKPMNRSSTVIPTHFKRDGGKPITEIDDWSLALS